MSQLTSTKNSFIPAVINAASGKKNLFADLSLLNRNSRLRSFNDNETLSPTSSRHTLQRESRAFSRASTSSIYNGTATTTIGQISLNGQLSNIRSGSTNVTGEISSQKQAGGIKENNPFNLGISSLPGQVSGLVEGAFSISSAIPWNFRGGFLVQYWKFNYNRNNGAISGNLVNTGAQYGLSYNLINANESILGSITTPGQILMDSGTTLTGKITQRQIQVKIQGQGSGLFGRVAFAINAILQR